MSNANVAAVATANNDAPVTAPKAGDNSKKVYNAFIKRVEKFGEGAGRGEASLPAFALDAVRMAADRVIGIAKPIAGEQDDASTAYHAFQTAKEKARGKVYTKEGSYEQQVSKFRQIVKVGATLFDDGVKVIDRAVELHTQAAASDATKADMKAGTLYAFLVDVAREQNKEETKGIPLDDDAINKILFPGDAEKKSDIERIKTAIKGLERLKNGSKGDDGFKPMDSAYLDAAIENMTELLYDLDPSLREKAEAKAKLELVAAQFGLKLSAVKKAA